MHILPCFEPTARQRRLGSKIKDECSICCIFIPMKFLQEGGWHVPATESALRLQPIELNVPPPYVTWSWNERQQRVSICERSAASSSVGVQTEAFDRNSDASRLVWHTDIGRCTGGDVRLAVDMDIHGYIHGYIHVWISDLGHAVDISMDMWYRYLIVNITNSI